MRSGAKIQFRTKERSRCVQRARSLSRRWRVSKRTLQRMGYIIIRRPIAVGLEGGRLASGSRVGGNGLGCEEF